jgi:serine/threonine protein kinase
VEREVVGSRIGPYEVLFLLSHGGAASSYRAIDTRFGDAVFLKAASHPSLAQYLHREASMLRVLAHPGIVRLLDYRDDSEGGPYLVTSWHPGWTFDALMTGATPVSRPELLAIVRDVADVLAYCHSVGIVHRDIKPSNILVEPSGSRFAPTIVDFELAARVGELEDASRIVGTLARMSPEQWRGQITAASDVYAVGTLLFEILVGERPFASQNDPMAMAALVAQGVPPSQLARVPRQERGLVAQMLSVEPSARPTMHEVHAELTAIARRLGASPSKATVGVDAPAASAPGSLQRREPSRAPGVMVGVVLGLLVMAVADAFSGGLSGGQGFLLGAIVGLVLTAIGAIVDAARDHEASRPG